MTGSAPAAPGPKLGFLARNMGPQSTAPTLAGVAEAAEGAGLDDLWVVDHVAIPPDEAEGSEGRYLDPLAALAFLAGRTRRIGLGTHPIGIDVDSVSRFEDRPDRLAQGLLLEFPSVAAVR